MTAPRLAHRTAARSVGALYLLTFATSIPALALKQPVLDGGLPGFAHLAALLEIVLALACVGTAVALYPVARRFSPTIALGFVGSRILEGAAVLAGVVSLLALVSLRGGSGDDGAVGTTLAPALVALHDQAFLVGPGLMPCVNALLLGPLLFRHRLVPRVIPLIGMIGAPLLTLSGIATVLGMLDQVSVLAGIAALPIAVWEFGLGAWLFLRGFQPAAFDGVEGRD